MKLFGAKKSAPEAATPASMAATRASMAATPASASVPVRNVVVFDGSAVHDWPALFASLGPLPDGSRIRCLQASWIDAECTVYGDSGCHLALKPVKDSFGEHVDRKSVVSVRPDFVLQRNQCRGPSPQSDRRHVLYGLVMAGIPAMNSLMSEYMQLERAVMLGALREINQRLGDNAFPLNEVSYYSSCAGMVISPELPAVLKISHAHAGQGKIKIESQQHWADMRSVLVIHDDYVTAEPFFPYDSGIRVQKVCGTYRVWEKIPTGSSWKSQFGGSNLVEIPCTEQFKLWADECAACFGGLDICAVDALKRTEPDGTVKYVIIELNGTACGFQTNSWMEDSKRIAAELHRRLGLVLEKRAHTTTKGDKLKSLSAMKAPIQHMAVEDDDRSDE